jgi:hypothetical protein
MSAPWLTAKGFAMKKLAVSLVLGLLALGGSPQPVRADDAADALLAKYRSFVGWSLGDGSVNALRIKGQIAELSTFDETCQGTRFAQFNTGLRSGRPFLVAGGEGTGWVSHAGEAKDFPKEVAQDTFTQALLLCNAFARYPGRIVVETSGTANFPAGFALVALSIPNEPMVSLMISKDTGQLTSVVVDGIASYEPADLKNIDAKRKIYTRWKRLMPGSGSADMLISTLQLNVTVDPAIFSRTANDAAPPPDPATPVRF